MKSQRKKKVVVSASPTETILCIGSETTKIPIIALPKPRWIQRALLTFALLSGAGLMVPVIFAGPLVLDEHGTYWLVGPENPGTLWQRSLDYENIPPLAPLLQRQFCYLFGASELSLRLLSVVSYWLAIAAVYLLAREVLDPVRAGLASNVLAWHPRVLGEIRIARSYGLTTLLATLAFWTTVRWSRRINSWWIVPWVLLNSALLWTHYLNAALVAAQVAWLIWTCRQSYPQSRIILVIGIACVITSTIPLIPPVIRIATLGENFGFQSEQPLLDVIAPLWWLGLPCGWLVGQLWMLRRRPGERLTLLNTSTFILLFGWGLLPTILAAAICSEDLSSLSNPRYRIGFAGPSACLVVLCLSYRRSLSAAVISVAVALSLGWLLSSHSPWELKRLGNPCAEEWRAMAQSIEQRGRAGEPLFVQSGFGEGFIVPIYYDDKLFHDYAACRMGRFYLKTPHPRFALPFLWDRSREMCTFYEELLRSYSQTEQLTLWVAGATDTDLNRYSLIGFERILKKCGYSVINSHQSANTVLIQYGRRSEL